MVKSHNSTVSFTFNNLQPFLWRKLCEVIRVVIKWGEANFPILLTNCPVPIGLCLIRACGGFTNCASKNILKNHRYPVFFSKAVLLPCLKNQAQFSGFQVDLRLRNREWETTVDIKYNPLQSQATTRLLSLPAYPTFSVCLAFPSCYCKSLIYKCSRRCSKSESVLLEFSGESEKGPIRNNFDRYSIIFCKKFWEDNMEGGRPCLSSLGP